MNISRYANFDKFVNIRYIFLGTGSFRPESRSPPESFRPESRSSPESFRPYSRSPRFINSALKNEIWKIPF